jgi:hypothetical protein
MNTQVKRILYLHIGMAKTGTSALQYFFDSNPDQLNEQGVIYPKTGQYDDYSHHNIPFSLAKNAHKVALSRAGQVSLLNSLNEEIKDYPRVLLSSECFPMLGNHDLFLEFLSQYEVKIICYLRRQDLFVESHYKQVVADPASPNLHYKIQSHVAKLHKTMAYFPLLWRWAKLGSLIIRPYEREYFVDGNIFSDFGNTIDVKIDKSFVFPNENINPTDSNAFVDLVRILKSHKMLGSVLNKISIDELRALVNRIIPDEKTSSLFSPQERKDLLRKYSSSNKKIAQLYLDRDELFSDPDISGDEGLAYAGLSEKEVFSVLSGIVAKVSSVEMFAGMWKYFDGMSEKYIMRLFSETLDFGKLNDTVRK